MVAHSVCPLLASCSCTAPAVECQGPSNPLQDGLIIHFRNLRCISIFSSTPTSSLGMLLSSISPRFLLKRFGLNFGVRSLVIEAYYDMCPVRKLGPLLGNVW